MEEKACTETCSGKMALLHLGWASYIYKLGFLTPDAALA